MRAFFFNFFVVVSYFPFLFFFCFTVVGSMSSNIIERSFGSTSLFGKTSDNVDAADSDSDHSYVYSRCSGSDGPPSPSNHTEVASFGRSEPVVPERKRKCQLFLYLIFDLIFGLFILSSVVRSTNYQFFHQKISDL